MGNPTFGVVLNGIIVGLMAGFVPFEQVTDIMVLGTLVAFAFVCLGALRLKLVNPIVSLIGLVGCVLLALHLDPIVLNVYCITLPIGLIIYVLYGRTHSKLALARTNGDNR